MFNEKSVIVQAWVRQIMNPEGTVSYEDVPKLSNLQEATAKALKEKGYQISETL